MKRYERDDVCIINDVKKGKYLGVVACDPVIIKKREYAPVFRLKSTESNKFRTEYEPTDIHLVKLENIIKTINIKIKNPSEQEIEDRKYIDTSNVSSLYVNSKNVDAQEHKIFTKFYNECLASIENNFNVTRRLETVPNNDDLAECVGYSISDVSSEGSEKFISKETTECYLYITSGKYSKGMLKSFEHVIEKYLNIKYIGFIANDISDFMYDMENVVSKFECMINLKEHTTNGNYNFILYELI